MSDTDSVVPMEACDDDGVCKGSSSLEFAKYVPHGLMALNFKVEYSATLPTKPMPKTVQYTIGWSSYLPELNASKQVLDQRIDFYCQMGPGNSAMRDILWCLDSKQVDSM